MCDALADMHQYKDNRNGTCKSAAGAVVTYSLNEYCAETGDENESEEDVSLVEMKCMP